MIAALLIAGLGAAAPVATDTTFVIERGSRVIIEHPEGNVEVRGVAGREARISIDGERRDGARVSRADGVYYVGAGALWEDAGADILVTLPSDVELEVRARKGDIRVHAVAGDVAVETVEGGIEVVGAGAVVAHTVEGGIRVQDVSGPVLANSGEGDLWLEDVAGPIEAHTIDGGVVVIGSGADAVAVSTISGDIHYEGAVLASGTYALGTHGGDVVFAFPARAGAQVSAVTFAGSLEPSFPVQFRRGRGRAAEFTIGDGGAQVTLESFAGDIHLIRPGERVPGSE